MTLTKRQIIEFQSKIFRWWKTNKRDLPWRHTRDSYAIAVSEVMLQQTQVLRVLPKYAEFIEAWPNVQSLSEASPGDVLRIWKGMGYNRRALYLHKMAKIIVGIYRGKFPQNEKSLVKLPGLGKYTARAILVFAFRQNIACVDTNIRQIITHFFFHDKKQRPEVIQSVADQLVPYGKSWEWHQALMDYGAMNANEWRHSERLSRAKSKENRGTEQKQIPFRQTNRFYRGKIIDLLRNKNWEYQNLLRYGSSKYNKSVSFIDTIITDLIKDGLISRSASDIISLPQ